jgi:glutaredoxin
MKITTYVKTGCPWCIAVTEYLNKENIEHEEKNVTENLNFFMEMEKISEQTKAPVVVIDGHVLADTDKEAVAEYLQSKK